MQRIFYRTVDLAWSGYDRDNWNYFNPDRGSVERLCGEMEQWANTNGFRIVSVTPTTRTVVMGKSEFAHSATTTAGFVFVCEYVGAGQGPRS